jgi:hypothetical protein
MFGNSSVAAQLAAPEEELISMELVSWNNGHDSHSYFPLKCQQFAGLQAASRTVGLNAVSNDGPAIVCGGAPLCWGSLGITSLYFIFPCRPLDALRLALIANPPLLTRRAHSASE